MEREESGSSREHHLPPVKDESIIRVFVRSLHGISAAGNEPEPLANFLSEEPFPEVGRIGAERFELADLAAYTASIAD